MWLFIYANVKVNENIKIGKSQVRGGGGEFH